VDIWGVKSIKSSLMSTDEATIKRSERGNELMVGNEEKQTLEGFKANFSLKNIFGKNYNLRKSKFLKICSKNLSDFWLSKAQLNPH
jgi:hypothetical protein